MKKAFIISVLIAGMLFALQVRSFRQVRDIVARSGERNVLSELRILQLANQQLRIELKAEEKALEDIQTKIAGVTIEEELRQLRLFAGEEPVQGEGIEITVNNSIEAFWITDLIAQLVSAGAEAFAINDVRLTPRTAGFRDVAGGLVMRRDFLRPPFRIAVIGAKKSLRDSIAQHGGIIDRIEKDNPGTRIGISERDTVFIPGLIRFSEVP